MAYESFEKGNSPWRAKLGAKKTMTLLSKKKKIPLAG